MIYTKVPSIVTKFFVVQVPQQKINSWSTDTQEVWQLNTQLFN